MNTDTSKFVEENMLKPVIAATAVLAIAGTSLVYAQQRFGDHGFGDRGGFGDGGSRFEHRRHFSADDMAAFADARIAALKAGLELTADQTKNWPAFEAALRNMAQLRIERIQGRQAAANQDTQTQTSPFDRLARRADRMSKASAALKQIADSGAPLYQSLTDAQKARFTVLARVLTPHRDMHASNGGSEGGWRRGYGFDSRRDGRNWWGHGGRRFGQNDRTGDDMQNQDGGSDQGSRL
jgi:zinc resistance-associated protein